MFKMFLTILLVANFIVFNLLGFTASWTPSLIAHVAFYGVLLTALWSKELGNLYKQKEVAILSLYQPPAGKLWEPVAAPEGVKAYSVNDLKINLLQLDFLITQKLCTTVFRASTLEEAVARVYAAYEDTTVTRQEGPLAHGWYYMLKPSNIPGTLKAHYSFWDGENWLGCAYPSMTADHLARNLKAVRRGPELLEGARVWPAQTAIDYLYPTGFLERPENAA